MNLFRYNNFIIPSFLFYLIPIGLVTGPFLPDLFLSIIAIIFLIDIFKEKILLLFIQTFLKYLFVFILF